MAEVETPLPSIETILPPPPVEPLSPLQKETETKVNPALTPPASDESNKSHGSQFSDLSELDLAEEEDDDDTEIEPDHYYDGGRIPVFKPTMDQFRSFERFVAKIDKYGMKSGIVKVIPPQEWRDSLPALDEAVKTIKVKNPITQEFSGTHGTYTQANIEKQRSYNLPQWKALTEESQHQPPARRGEKRKNQERPTRAPARSSSSRPKRTSSTKSATSEDAKRKPGRPRKGPLPKVEIPPPAEDDDSKEAKAPPTPTSPSSALDDLDKPSEPIPFEPAPSEPVPSEALPIPVKTEAPPEPKKSNPSKSRGRQPKTVAERRKYNTAETLDQIDETAFKDFDYRFYPGEDEFAPQRCAELEALYWRTLTFAAPMYGADMPGSLFDDSTTSWNVAKLPNILDVLGAKVPGVNTAYLYLGMWKATFAWHLEDVDLYSINYIHFGAPKQWYSISQEDARRFENAMKSVWPNDAKHCSQFLRHKTYLISPALLQSQFNIKVNKLVHYEGEFVITFPYGYHSGYNMGYNCAESVNFATEQWLDYGKIAKKCDCEADSVWIDVAQIERRLRGEPTPEYIEETDDEDDTEGADHLPSPPASVAGKGRGKKRKRNEPTAAQGKKKVKKIKLRIKTHTVEPCVLCPNNLPAEPLLPTDTGRSAHRSCAYYTPETYISDHEGVEKIYNIADIDKARLDLKCSYCRSKKGACFQCSSRKCTRAYHATCAAPAGVQVELGPTSVYGEDGTEYIAELYDFRCRFHRPKRSKNVTGESLESSGLVRKFARSLKETDVVQVQYLFGDIFAGTVVENRPSERAVVIDILPEGDRIEVEWRWIVALDPADSQLPKPSADAKPLPEHMSKQIPPDRNAEFGPPQEGDIFNDPAAIQKWAEFNSAPAPHNANQAKIDFETPNRLWYYLAKTSTEAKAQYTEDLAKPRHNPASLPKESSNAQAPMATPSNPQRTNPINTSSIGPNYRALNAAMGTSKQQHQQVPQSQPSGLQKPYQYKPRQIGDLNSNGLTEMKVGDQFCSVQQDFNKGTTFKQQPSPLSQNNFTSTTTGNQLSPQLPPNPYTTNFSHQNSVNSPLQSRGMQQLHNCNSAPAAPMALMGPSSATAMTGNSQSMLGRARAFSQPENSMQEHIQRISKYPYLRHSFSRRDPQYISPYIPSGAFSEPYATFIPQSQSSGEAVRGSAAFYLERPVVSPYTAYSHSSNPEWRRPPFHQDFSPRPPRQAQQVQQLQRHPMMPTSGSSPLRTSHQMPQQAMFSVQKDVSGADSAVAMDPFESISNPMV